MYSRASYIYLSFLPRPAYTDFKFDTSANMDTSLGALNTTSQTPLSGQSDFDETSTDFWPPALLPDDQFGWDQFLKEYDGPSRAANTQADHYYHVKKPCKCFKLALQNIEKLDQCQRSLDAKAIDHALGVAKEAVQACNQFSNCMSSCHHSQVLLYIAILQQLDSHYSLLNKCLMSTAESEGQNPDAEVSIGSFQAKLCLRSMVGKAILTSEMMGAASCALKLSKVFQAYASEGSAESKCQQELQFALATSLRQGATEFLNSALYMTLP
ncbi:hypothetical protein L228DRAFT_261231 [Xylona heveae TC161]|uniref:Uncharacterized protein n=1 Tax=Xylona heveae (strain CBS 132557 / TC161) TaxID=1328760 RepID=A0A165GBF6_XYLHT|nr:hypothetical protein L228DRAFT_261231 [Xylona heveae TC161]KZF21987.1 hypothetical protein L228DRAFT_261231 [Xylona heveae TC161]